MATLSQFKDRLRQREALPALCPSDIWDRGLSQEIENTSGIELTGQENPSTVSVEAVKSGLLLWNDDLYGSHTLSQQLENDLGSCWHGLMHRREGDFSNAKYWYSKAGDLPIFPSLYEKAKAVSTIAASWEQWDPHRFIDEVEWVTSNGSENSKEAEELRKIQEIELSLLLDYSLRA
ncbi:hypothetical protein [Alteribacillus sp. HJP-4]|uniref:hypothetical protein n=1 Tax=Alteribacillus sp. HJP-4 TaxID=2775394 RepID=UPI0035CCF25F